MNILRLFAIINVFLLCSCAKYQNVEISILRNLYNYPSESFRLDTLSNFGNLSAFINSRYAKFELKPCTLEGGFIYNLKDSTFIPSVDTTQNIVFTCIQSYPSCPAFYGIYGNVFNINDIKNDSLTVQIDYYGSELKYTSRLSSDSLKGYFSCYLDTLFNSEPTKCLPIVFLVNVKENPNVKVIQKIFNSLFWSYNSNLIHLLNEDLKRNGMTLLELSNMIIENKSQLSYSVPPFEFWFNYNDGRERYLE